MVAIRIYAGREQMKQLVLRSGTDEDMKRSSANGWCVPGYAAIIPWGVRNSTAQSLKSKNST